MVLHGPVPHPQPYPAPWETPGPQLIRHPIESHINNHFKRLLWVSDFQPGRGLPLTPAPRTLSSIWNPFWLSLLWGWGRQSALWASDGEGGQEGERSVASRLESLGFKNMWPFKDSIRVNTSQGSTIYKIIFRVWKRVQSSGSVWLWELGSEMVLGSPDLLHFLGPTGWAAGPMQRGAALCKYALSKYSAWEYL